MRAEDEADYVEYVTARLPSLHRAAYLLCGRAQDADDIVQTALTRLYRHWRRARAADNIDGYAHRILVRAYLDDRRGWWWRVRLMADTPDRPHANASDVEDRDAVHTMLSRLSYAQRAVLVLRFGCDMSVEDAAATDTGRGAERGGSDRYRRYGRGGLRRPSARRHPARPGRLGD